MYTVIDRRGVNPARLDETTARAQAEYFPELQAAAGFIRFYLVADDDLYTAIVVWDDKAHADAFEPTMRVGGRARGAGPPGPDAERWRDRRRAGGAALAVRGDVRRGPPVPVRGAAL